MKQVLNFAPTFTPGGAGVGTLDFSGYSGFQLRGLLAVINETRKVLIYCPADGVDGYTAFGSGIITLSADTSTHSSGDVLSALYDSEITISSGSMLVGGRDANGVVRPILTDTAGVSQVGNCPVTLADTFATFDTVTNWTLTTQAIGDLVQVDGNAISASYLVLSLDPLTENTETVIESKGTWMAPLRLGINASTSQRTLGQEFSIEMVSTETPTESIATSAIQSYFQTGTIATFTTAAPHGLQVGDLASVGRNGDSRVNYSNLTIASCPTPSQFTSTGGSGGTITSLNIGSSTSPITTLVGTAYYKSPFRYAPNGTSMILDNATATNACFYTKSNGVGAIPSGTIITTHAATIATSASTQAINAIGAYAFQAASAYELMLNPEMVEWINHVIDASTAAYTIPFKREQAVPDPNKNYKVRLRAVNCASLTRPNAKVVSIAKSGSTLGTFTTDANHGLNSADLVQIYGNGDQTAATGNLTVATAITTTSLTAFTATIGTGTSGTVFGGLVARVNGGTLLQGITPIAIQSVTNPSTINAAAIDFLGSAAWTIFVIGDYVNVYGCRKISDGTDAGFDGVYKVYAINTTTFVATLIPIGFTPSGTTVAASGAVIKRTDLRIDAIRVAAHERQLVETVAGINRGDVAVAVPVYITAGTVTTVTSLSQIAGVPANSFIYDEMNLSAGFQLRSAIS